MSQVPLCAGWLESQRSQRVCDHQVISLWTGITRSCKAYESRWVECRSSASRNWKGRWEGWRSVPHVSDLFFTEPESALHLHQLFIFFNMQLPSRNLTWIVHFKNHGRVLLFFQIPSLEVLLVQIRRNKSAVTSWGHLEKFIFKMQWSCVSNATRTTPSSLSDCWVLRGNTHTLSLFILH